MTPVFDPQQLQLWLHGLGAWAWPVFLGLQVIQVVVFWIPGEVIQIAGGAVFGVWWGTLLSSIGVLGGNAIAFYLARRLGKARIEKWLEKHEYHRFQTLIHHPRLDVVLGVIFFLPFLPKDIFCYLAGLSDVKPFRFFWVTTLVRVPSLLFSSWVGDLAVHGVGILLLAVLGVGAVIGGLVLIYRKSLLALLVR